MIYVLCEDSGAGKLYIECFLKAIEVIDYELICAVGNLNLVDKFDSLVSRLVTGDKLVLLFDYVISDKNTHFNKVFDAESFLTNVITECANREVLLWYPNYYCFEELFLSCSILLDLMNHSKYREAVALVNTQLKSNATLDYWKQLADSLPLVDGKSPNREHTCKKLLGAASGSIKLVDFGISKSHFGQCWLLPCDDIDNDSKEFICKKCKYFKNNKIQSFESDSILHMNSLFSFLFENIKCDTDDSTMMNKMSLF